MTERTKSGEAIAAFWRLVELDTDDCIEWPYTRCHGYGYVTHDGRLQRVHRLALIVHTGHDRPGMYAAHGPCHNPACMNACAGHVYWATPAGNQADRERDGTRLRGNRHPMATITEADALDIIGRMAEGANGQRLAEEYGVSRTQIHRIKNGSSWGHLPRP